MDLREISKTEVQIKSSLAISIQQGLSSRYSEDTYDEPAGFQGPGVAYGDEPPKLKETDYLSSATGWVYAAVTAIADAVSKSLKLRLYKSDGNGEITEIQTHKALDLIYKVNKFQTFLDFIWLTQQYLDLTGEAPWFVDRGKEGDGEPQNLLLLRPDKLFINKSDAKNNDSEIGGYTYKLDYTGKSIPIKVGELIFLKYPDPINYYRGKGTLQAAALTYDIDNYSEEYNKRFFFNGARPDSLFLTKNKLVPAQRDAIKSQINSLYKGANNAHKTALLEDGMDWKPMSLNAKDMEFMEQQKFSLTKILSIFRVPKSIVAISDDVNLANAKIGEYVFLKWTVKPKLEKIVAQLNEFYLPMFKGTEQMFFAFDDPTPVDVDANVKRFDSALGKGYMTLNEIRAELNLPDVGPDGDVLYVPNSIVPLDQAGTQIPSFITGSIKINAQKSDAIRKNKIVQLSAGGYYKAFRIASAVGKAKKMMRAFQGNIAKIAAHELKKTINRKRQKEQDAKKEWDLTKKQYGEETKGAFDAYEKYFKQTTSLIFQKQAQTVLAKFPKNRSQKSKINPDKYLLDSVEETNVMVRIYDPIIKQIVRIEGARAAKLAGQRALDLATKPVRDYLNNRAYKFSFEMNEETNKMLAEALAQGVKEGEGIAELAKRVADLFDGFEQYRAERIARSEVIRASNFAAQEAYTQSGVVEKKEWFAYDDDRSCEWCPEMDGKIIGLSDNYFDKGDQFKGNQGGVIDLDYLDVEYPPLHVNCRCRIVPARFV